MYLDRYWHEDLTGDLSACPNFDTLDAPAADDREVRRRLCGDYLVTSRNALVLGLCTLPPK